MNPLKSKDIVFLLQEKDIQNAALEKIGNKRIWICAKCLKAMGKTK